MARADRTLALHSPVVRTATAHSETAAAAARRAGVSVRDLSGLDDVARVVDLIERVWGPGNMPPALLRAFEHAGSVWMGAEAEGRLVGFVLGFLGWEERVHLHSHMLAVLPEWQSRGVGLALKLAQRAACLDHGVDEVRWTFDPLVARNAWFNLEKLGTVATRFLEGFYGEMTDELNRGDRSDRFEVRWYLRSPRVGHAVGEAGGSPGPQEASSGARAAASDWARGPGGGWEGAPCLLQAAGQPEAPEPVPTGAEPGDRARVTVPLDYPALRSRHPELGPRWRETSGRAFESCFRAGLVATGFEVDRAAGVGRYRFERRGVS